MPATTSRRRAEAGRRPLAIALLILATTASACSGGGRSRQAAIPFVAVDPASVSATDQAIATAQARLRAAPADGQARVQLAVAFLQKVRETADPTYYGKADGLLASLGGTTSSNPEVLLAEGTLTLARHQFATARRVGQQAAAALPDNESAYGIVVDADNELGRYDEAAADTQKMIDLRPNLASLSRASYSRELRGDVPGAIEAMTQAVTAGGSGGGENVAYVQVLLGNLLLNSGRPDQADTAYAAALASFPGFPPALAGQAAVLVTRGRPAAAAAVLAEVVKTVPLTQYAIAQGDDLAAAGQADAAKAAYDLVDVIARLFAANGVNVDTEQALFDADHHPGPAAVARARHALIQRPSVLGHDVLAWNLLQAGQPAQAATEMAKALALGDRDPQLRYHAAAIAMANANRPEATTDLSIVLAGNARFSAHAEAAVAALADQLGLRVPPAAPMA